MGAGQTIAIDIGRLRDEQVADEAGRLIGKAVGRGQVMWSARGKETLTLIGRAEQADLTKALSSSYACQNCCENSFYDGWADPLSQEIVPDETLQFTANQQDQNCFGTLLVAYVAYADWDSSDESVATVDGNGLATAEEPGETNIQATWYVVTWLLLVGFPECEPYEETFFTSADLNVAPFIQLNAFGSWSPDTIASNGASNISISVTASNDVPSSTSVTLSFGASLTGGSVSFTITPIEGDMFTFTVGPGETKTVTAKYAPVQGSITGLPDVKAVCSITVPTGIAARPMGGQQESSSVLKIR